MLSEQLQIGKAGEHLVCVDLIMRGYNAFLSDQGLPFDVVAEKSGKIKTIQVKTASRLWSYGSSKNVYRYNIMRGRVGERIPIKEAPDFFAFVGLDRKVIAYLKPGELVKDGKIVKAIQFKIRELSRIGNMERSTSLVKRKLGWGRYIEDYDKFEF